MNEMKWLVTVMEPYYPSVFEFNSYGEARVKYDELVKDNPYDLEDEQYKVIMSSVLYSHGSYWRSEVDWT